MPVAASQITEVGDGPPPLTLREAIRHALERHPALKTFAYRERALGGARATAGLRPAPELQLEVENVAGTGNTSGFDRAEATLALSQVVELGDKRGARVGLIDARAHALEIERRARELDVLAAVTRRFIAVVAARERRQLAERAAELAQAAVASVERRVNAARAAQAEAARAHAALALARLNQADAERAFEAARLRLAALWNATAPDFGALRADLYEVGAAGDFEELARRIEANPDFLRFAGEARLREAELRLARSRAHTDLRLTAGVRRLEDTEDTALMFGLSLPLFSGRRAEGAIAEAQARREAVGSEREAALIDARARLFALYQARAQAIETVAVLQDEVIPQQRQALDQTREGYERGRYGYLERVTARRELIDAERALIDAAERAHSLRADIESLTAEPLTGADGGTEPEKLP